VVMHRVSFVQGAVALMILLNNIHKRRVSHQGSRGLLGTEWGIVKMHIQDLGEVAVNVSADKIGPFAGVFYFIGTIVTCLVLAGLWRSRRSSQPVHIYLVYGHSSHMAIPGCKVLGSCTSRSDCSCER
jgi:hypothetical protein